MIRLFNFFMECKNFILLLRKNNKFFAFLICDLYKKSL